MRRERLSGYFIDVSKYIITGVFISSMFRDLESGWLTYVLSGAIAAITLVVGLLIIKKEN